MNDKYQTLKSHHYLNNKTSREKLGVLPQFLRLPLNCSSDQRIWDLAKMCNPGARGALDQPGRDSVLDTIPSVDMVQLYRCT